MKSTAIIAACIGAIIGAVAWAVIAAQTGYEVGYVAWGVGLAVGLGARRLGGEGQAMALLCAGLSLGAILLGKVFAVQYGAPTEIRKIAENLVTHEVYDELMADAEAFAAVTSESAYPEFMIAHGDSESATAGGVTPEELEDFKTHRVPELHRLLDEKPGYAQWREQTISRMVKLTMAKVDVAEAVRESLGLMDILFAALGVFTAYKVVMGAEAAPANTA